MIIFNFFKYLFLYIKYVRILNAAYKEEHLIQKLNVALNSEFDKDWVGRLYTVINPLVQKIPTDPADGSSSIIYNFMADGSLSDKIYIEKWIMDRMNFMNSFLRNNMLFELLTYNITELDDNKNYLVVFEPVPFQPLKKWTKWFVALLVVLILLLVGFLIII